MNLRRYIDPDGAWFSRDKFLHGAGGASIAFLALVVGLPWLAALLVVFIVGLAYEVGQLDTALNPSIVLKGTGKSPLGEVGFGVGLLDMAWNMAGAVVLIIVFAILF